MTAADLPAALIDALRRARELERLADGVHRQRRAIAATSVLMLAAVREGHTARNMANLLCISPAAAQKRVLTARRHLGDAEPGLVVDEHTRPSKRKIPELQTPVDDREWLSRGEAVQYLGLGASTIGNYHRYGLLPNTREVAVGWRLYLRADLDRVRHAPRRGTAGYLDRRALHEQIRDAAI